MREFFEILVEYPKTAITIALWITLLLELYLHRKHGKE